MFLFAGLKLLEQLEEESRSLSEWLDLVETFLRDNSYIPVGESELLDRLLDASNVSPARTSGLHKIIIAQQTN